MPSPSAYLRHIRCCFTIRRLLREHPSENLENLYWYDLRLRDAVSWKGIGKVLRWGLRRREEDAVFGNYGLSSLYFADTSRCLPTDHPASVWNCLSLPSKPSHTRADEISEALKNNASAIKSEFKAVASRIGTHPDSDSFASTGRWTGLFLSGAKGEIDTELAQQCPQTTAVLRQLPICRNFGFVAFSGMEPGTHVRAHTGSSNLRLRYHLGVDIPEPDKGKIRVADQWYYWEQDGVIAFDDSYEHEVVYDGEKDRIVLIVDVWHPNLIDSDIEVLSHPVFRLFGK